MDRNLIDYLPEVLKTYKEFRELMRVEQPQIEALWDACDSLMNEGFLDTETEVGAAKWEKILEIKPKNTDSLEVRNFRIHGRLIVSLPYTERTFCKQLAALCGEDGYSYKLDYDKFSLQIKVALTSKKLKDEVQSLAERIVPQNYILDVDLMYNTHRIIQERGLTNRQLAQYTHREIQEEPLID